MQYKFKIGDEVKIVYTSQGCGGQDINRVARIIQLGEYCHGPGYEISPGYNTNSQSRAYDSMCGERSFELVKSSSKDEILLII